LILCKLQIILEEGDVLYLPPFYFHRVESFDNSKDSVIMALNVWTDSYDQLLMKNVYSKAFYIPFVDKQV
jgi:ribosomal protein L16 Arg81 hydroxylase